MKLIALILVLFLYGFSGAVSAQHMHNHSGNKKTEKEAIKESPEKSESDAHQHNTGDENSEQSHCCSGMKTADAGEKNAIVREGVIDLIAIDTNKDGKVYQDQMCWNVISDTPGKCPLCGMTLKEVSLKKAEENLVRNNFKVKA